MTSALPGLDPLPRLRGPAHAQGGPVGILHRLLNRLAWINVPRVPAGRYLPPAPILRGVPPETERYRPGSFRKDEGRLHRRGTRPDWRGCFFFGPRPRICHPGAGRDPAEAWRSLIFPGPGLRRESRKIICGRGVNRPDFVAQGDLNATKSGRVVAADPCGGGGRFLRALGPGLRRDDTGRAQGLWAKA